MSLAYAGLGLGKTRPSSGPPFLGAGARLLLVTMSIGWAVVLALDISQSSQQGTTPSQCQDVLGGGVDTLPAVSSILRGCKVPNGCCWLIGEAWAQELSALEDLFPISCPLPEPMQAGDSADQCSSLAQAPNLPCSLPHSAEWQPLPFTFTQPQLLSPAATMLIKAFPAAHAPALLQAKPLSGLWGPLAASSPTSACLMWQAVGSQPCKATQAEGWQLPPVPWSPARGLDTKAQQRAPSRHTPGMSVPRGLSCCLPPLHL